jgi:hypothetical protein
MERGAFDSVGVGIEAGLMIASAIAKNYHNRLEPPGEHSARLIARKIGEGIASAILAISSDPDAIERRAERIEEAMQQIAQWADAYPLNVFPEPDMIRAAELLRAGGITLDAVSASCMRHVIEGVGKIARDALA